MPEGDVDEGEQGRAGSAATRLRSTLRASFAVLFLVVCALAVGAFLITRSLHDRAERGYLRDVIPLRQAARGLLVDLLNEETGVRGFLITGREPSLQPYDGGRAAEPRDVADLQAAAARDPGLAALVAPLLAERARLDVYFAAQVALAREGPAGIATARQRVEDGKAIFDRFRGRADAVSAFAERRTRAVQDSQDQLLTSITVLVAALGLLGAAIVAAFWWTLPRRAYALVRDREERHGRLARMQQQTEDLRAADAAARGRLELLGVVARRLSSAADEQAVVAAILEGTRAALAASTVGVFLADATSGRIRIAGAAGYTPADEATLARAFADGIRLPSLDAWTARVPVLLGRRDELRARYPELAERGLERAAYAAVPIEIDDACVGTLGIAFPEERTFDDDFLLLSRAIAAQCAIALQRARLFEAERAAREAAEREAGRVAALQALAASLAAAHDVGAAAAAIVEHARRALRSSTCAVVLLGEDGLLHIREDVGYPPGLIDDLRDGFTVDADVPAAHAVRSTEAVYFPDLEAVRTRFPRMARVYGEVGAAGAVVPLATAEGVIGSIVLAFPGEETFDDARRTELQTFARLCAQAVERARLFEAEQGLRTREAEARARAELLAEIAVEVEARTGLHERADALIALLVPHLADLAFVERYDGDAREVLALRHRDPPLTHELRARRAARDGGFSLASVQHEGRARLVPHLPTPPPGRDGPGSAFAPHSLLAVPITARRRAVAVLALVRTVPERDGFDEADLAFVSEIASRMGFALENASLFEHEHDVALRLQRALLPQGGLEHEAVTMAARYEAGHADLEIGGDWYDTMVLRDGRIGLVVGDVVGRGLPAAVAMGTLRTALLALAARGAPPADVLAELDRFADDVDDARFATVAYAVLDVATGELRHASAGHPPILVVPPDGEPRFLDGGRSAPICAPLASPRRDASVVLQPGTTLVLYTDGLVERRDAPLDAGLARLAAAAASLRDGGPQALCAALVERLLGESEQRDDVAILAVRLDAPPTGTARVRG